LQQSSARLISTFALHTFLFHYESVCKFKCLALYLLTKIELASKFPLTKNNLQRHRRLCRVSIPNSQALSLLGRDLYDAHLQVLLGDGGYRSNNTVGNVSHTATDSFLSSLILNFSTSKAEEISKSVGTSVEDSSAKNAAPSHMWKSR